MLRQIMIKYIQSNPNIKIFITRLYNYILGRNKIRISSKNNIEISAVFMKSTKVSVKGINNTIVIKDSSSLRNCSIYINGNNNRIVIDQKVNLYQTEFYIEDDNNEISIGEQTSIHGSTHLAAIEGTSIHIGNDCLFSSDIHFRTGDSHSIIDLDGKRLNPSENIFIGNHVWIGTKVICLKGVHVANNCIVGAGSLLTKKFNEENIIVAGSPAKIVKYNANWLAERI